MPLPFFYCYGFSSIWLNSASISQHHSVHAKLATVSTNDEQEIRFKSKTSRFLSLQFCFQYTAKRGAPEEMPRVITAHASRFYVDPAG